ELGFTTHGEMMKQVADSYAEAAQLIGADGIIPSGFSMYRGVKAGLKMHRDTFHASLGVGRYALALTWQQALLGLPAKEDEFSCFDVPVTEEECASVRCAVDTAFSHPGVDD
ncbi:MAG: hypothetical protein J6R42_05115, partial [Clostridia bacterium]|nr:hypothetical protein [Clostridia bacterium]